VSDDRLTTTDWPTAVLEVELALDAATDRIGELERQVRHLDRCVANLLALIEAVTARLEAGPNLTGRS